MSETSFQERLKAGAETTEKRQQSVKNIEWDHFSMDAIERMTLGFLLSCNRTQFEEVLKLEIKPMALNNRIDVTELLEMIYHTNKELIDSIFNSYIDNKITKTDFRRLLAGLTVPIQVERDTIPR